ncbi:unnamed protein product [Lactuca virosa]|uniref:Aminotransferase-like plant mobile domain-containing protein n=1 Tax=Lactuca virosa TaxID=75947 RepID=A0AAU9MP51_9ASTR|nr:unnamed protein product [Lactuca virosa]
MECNFPNIFSDGYRSRHDDLDQKTDLTLKCVVGLHGRDVKTGILAAIYKLADNIDDCNRFAWGTYFWAYTSGLMRGMFEKIENFRIFKQVNPKSKKIYKYPVVGLCFRLRYGFWRRSQRQPESPSRKHSPPIVTSPPRRKKYKSKTSSTETATNASTLQQSEVEKTYMSSDTSTRSVKKKKMSTKTLVNRLIGVVADLTSKVDRVLQIKDEPDTWFGEEEDMVNEEEEETYYHGPQLDYDDTSTHGLEGGSWAYTYAC